MIGKTILHYEILEQIGEVRLVPHSGTAETLSLQYNGDKL